MTKFPGFEYSPDCGYSQLYHDWLSEIIANIDNVAELKVVLYAFRHTCGFQEQDTAKYITVDEFMFGRKRKDGTRLDFGTRLSEMSVRTATKKGVEHGFLVEEIDDSDLARIKKGYGLNFRCEDEESTEVQSLESEVQSLDPGPQTLEFWTKRVVPRSEKDTPERNQKKNTDREILVTQSQKELYEKALDFIALKKSVTYAELEQYLHRYIRVRGKGAIIFTNIKNVVAWTDVSADFCNIWQQVLNTKKVHCEVCDESLYKGRKPRLPITYKLEDQEEKHWHPLMINYISK